MQSIMFRRVSASDFEHMFFASMDRLDPYPYPL